MQKPSIAADTLDLAISTAKSHRSTVEQHFKQCQTCKPAKGKKRAAIDGMEELFLSIADARLVMMIQAHNLPDATMQAETHFKPTDRDFMVRSVAAMAADASLFLASVSLMRHDPDHGFLQVDRLVKALEDFKTQVVGRAATTHRAAH